MTPAPHLLTWHLPASPHMTPTRIYSLDACPHLLTWDLSGWPHLLAWRLSASPHMTPVRINSHDASQHLTWRLSASPRMTPNQCHLTYIRWTSLLTSAGIYTTFVMLMNTWSVMLTVLVLNLHHRNECRPIPGWLRTFALVGLARLLGMYSRKHPIIFPPDRRKSSAHEFLRFSIQQLEAGRDKKKDRSKKVQFSRKLSEQLRNNQFVCPVHDDLVSNSSPTSLPTKNSRVSWSMDTVRDRTEESEDRCFDPTRNSFLSHESGFSRQEASADDEEVMIEIQEWKQLARIMDRLFFWMTLTALISVSFVLSCLLFWQSNNEWSLTLIYECDAASLSATCLVSHETSIPSSSE